MIQNNFIKKIKSEVFFNFFWICSLIKNFNIKSRFFIPYRPAYVDILKNKEVLIFGNGPSLNESKNKIIKLVKNKNLVTLGANNITQFFNVDYLAFVNRKRFSAYSKYINSSSKLLLSPYFKKNFISSHISLNRDYFEIMYLNNKIKNTKKLIQNNLILYNCSSTTLLLILISYVMGAKNIFIAGLDGYKIENLDKSKSTHFYGIEKDLYQDRGKEIQIKKLKDFNYEQIKVLNILNNFFEKKNLKNYFKIITKTKYIEYYNSDILKIDE